MGRPRRILVPLMLGTILGLGSARAESPRIDYMLNCMGCHLADGAGTPGKVPALKGRIGKFLHVQGGREYLVQVPGTAQAALDDARVAGVLNWILENFSSAELPRGFVPYTEAEIAALRTPLADVVSVREGLLRQLERLEVE